MLPRLSRNSNRRSEIWICESKASEKCPQTTEQRKNPRHGGSRQPTKYVRKEKHHEAEEGHWKVV
jgi:hypothetical protein